jgi:hypothetical protein
MSNTSTDTDLYFVVTVATHRDDPAQSAKDRGAPGSAITATPLVQMRDEPDALFWTRVETFAKTERAKLETATKQQRDLAAKLDQLVSEARAAGYKELAVSLEDLAEEHL